LIVVAGILGASQDRFGRLGFDDLRVILPKLLSNVELVARELRGEKTPDYELRIAGWSASSRRVKRHRINPGALAAPR
jgi:hypothetical protein